MTSLSRDSFSKHMLALCVAYDKQLSEPLLETYWLALCDLDHASFASAVMACIRDHERWPTVALLRRLAMSVRVRELDRLAVDVSLSCNYHRQVRDKPSSEPYEWCPLCVRHGPKRIRRTKSEPLALSEVIDATHRPKS